MLFKQIKNLLPKKISEGVALNHLFSQHQLSRLGGFRKLPKLFKFSRIYQLLLGVLLLGYLSGYQPVLALPPLKKAVVHAQNIQDQSIEAAKLAQTFRVPHPGYLTTTFTSWHPGIDIATGYGMPLHPIADGKVAEIVYGFFGLGHYVVVDHKDGFRSTYGHMGRIFVSKDEIVTANSLLGEVGMTGRTTGPHTHLEVTKNGQYIDPQLLLPLISNWPNSAGIAPKGAGSYQNNDIKVEAPSKPSITPTPKSNVLTVDYFAKKDVNKNAAKLPRPLL